MMGECLVCVLFETDWSGKACHVGGAGQSGQGSEGNTEM